MQISTQGPDGVQYPPAQLPEQQLAFSRHCRPSSRQLAADALPNPAHPSAPPAAAEVKARTTERRDDPVAIIRVTSPNERCSINLNLRYEPIVAHTA
jgi:hypothetical protein